MRQAEEHKGPPAPEQDDLERRLRAGADGFRFGTLIEGIRAEGGPAPAEAGWTDALVYSPPRRPAATAAPEYSRKRVPAIWIGVAAVLLVLVLMQAVVLFIVAMRVPIPGSPGRRLAPREASAAQPSARPAAGIARAKADQTRTKAANPASRTIAAPLPAAAPGVTARRPAATAPRGDRRVRTNRVRHRTRHVRRGSAGAYRTVPPITGGTGGGEGRANAIIDRLPQ